MMVHIKRYIDKISAMESKQNKDVVIPITEARGLRDEIAKLLADLHQQKIEKSQEVIKVELGGTFK